MENLSAKKQEFGNMTKVILVIEMVLEGLETPTSCKVVKINIYVACEQALLFGQAKRASRERASEGPRHLAASPLARAFSRGSLRSPK